jgi:4-amino-4-deoxy-L-arabinose transferase-like glycosyltransferase
MTVCARFWTEAVLMWLLLFTADVALLWTSGAFRAEFGEYPDEPAHYITALMVRDYVASHAPSPPMAFAENYYLHYPKVALGFYPPFLYVVEAAWMLVFPVSRASILLLLAVLTALAATMLHFIVRNRFGFLAGAAAGLLLISTPVVQRYCGMVMAEALCLLMVTSAVICFSRYLETQRWQDAACFGILASLAILTKQVALFLALVPLLALLLTRRFGWLRRPSFWLPALIVLALAVPWYAYAHTLLRSRIVDLAAMHLAHPPFGEQAAQFLKLGGLGLLLPMAAGVWTRVVRPALRGQPVQPMWAVWTSVIVSLLLLRLIMPAADDFRHLLYIQPAIVLFAVAGIARLASSLPPARWKPAKRAVLLALAAGLAFGLETFEIPQRRHNGFSEAAEDLLANAELRKSVFLICSDAQGEGAFISEVATREKRPGHIVLRGNKMLASMGWDGAFYRLRYKTPEEVATYLESIPVGVLVVEVTGGQQRGHRRLVRQMLDSHADRWKLIGAYPRERRAASPGAEIRAYRLVGSESRPGGKIRIDLGGKLGKVIEN